MSASDAAGTGERTVVVYWPKSADKNIEIGLSQQIWGFRKPRIEKGRLEEFRRIEPGDLCVFGRVDGGPRVEEEPWLQADVTFLTLAVVTWVREGATMPVWPLEKDGELFPYRIGIEVIEKREQIAAAEMDATWKQALRDSAFSGGSPVVLDDADPASLIAAPGVPSNLTLDGPTDARVTTLRRLEQGRIRKAVLGTATTAICALCNRLLPARHVRMAHIKQRAHCSEDERADWQSNVMVACIECDALFEQGDLFVDDQGWIQAGIAPTTPHLDLMLQQRAGTRCAAFSTASAPYFEHRRLSHGH